MTVIAIQPYPVTDPLYGEAKRLREQVLRLPLGMTLRAVDTQHDADVGVVHYAATDENGVLLGTVTIAQEGCQAELKQMCVEPAHIGQRIGRRLVEAAEHQSMKRGVAMIRLHARVSAQRFYTALGYRVVSEPHDHIGIPHLWMERQLE